MGLGNKLKRYVVTEGQLQMLGALAYRSGFIDAQDLDHRNAELEKSAAECRAVEVPDWATHFAEGTRKASFLVTRMQEIPE